MKEGFQSISKEKIKSMRPDCMTPVRFKDWGDCKCENEDMKEELIQLASDKGFRSENQIFNALLIWALEDDLKYYLWMCELQKWLRDEYEIYVCCGITSTNNREKLLSYDTNIYTHESGHSQTFQEDESPEQALEAGLIEALKLIP